MSSRTLARLFPKPQAERLEVEYKLAWTLRDLIRQGKPAKKDQNLSPSLKTKMDALRTHSQTNLIPCYEDANKGLSLAKETAFFMANSDTTFSGDWLNKWMSEKGESLWDYNELLNAFSVMPKRSAIDKEKMLHLKLYFMLAKHIFIYDKSKKDQTDRDADLYSSAALPIVATDQASIDIDKSDLFDKLLAQYEYFSSDPKVMQTQLPLLLDCYKAYLQSRQITWSEMEVARLNRLLAICLPLNSEKVDVSQFKCYVELVKHVVSLGYLDVFPGFIQRLNTVYQNAPRIAEQVLSTVLDCYKNFITKLSVAYSHQTQMPALTTDANDQFLTGENTQKQGLDRLKRATVFQIDGLDPKLKKKFGHVDNLHEAAFTSPYASPSKPVVSSPAWRHSSPDVRQPDILTPETSRRYSLGDVRRTSHNERLTDQMDSVSELILDPEPSSNNLALIDTDEMDCDVPPAFQTLSYRHTLADKKYESSRQMPMDNRSSAASQGVRPESKWSALQFFINILGNFSPFTMFGGFLSTSKFPAANEMTREQHARNDESRESRKRYTV